MYFARRQEGDKSEMPHFAGQRGPEILRGLVEIEAVFDKNLNMLYDVKKTILDVKATTWHDDYNRSGHLVRGHGVTFTGLESCHCCHFSQLHLSYAMLLLYLFVTTSIHTIISLERPDPRYIIRFRQVWDIRLGSCDHQENGNIYNQSSQ